MKKRLMVVVAIIAGLPSAHNRLVAQGPGGRRRPKIARIERVRGNLYWITEGTGAPGASNLAVLVTKNGVVLVDTKNPGWAAEIQQLIETVTDKLVTTVINTHVHKDHTGSNNEFPTTVAFVAQENTRANLAKEVCEPIANCGFLSAGKARYLSEKTFKQRMSLGSGKDRVELLYFGPAHTNGDAIVVFPDARTVHLGDLFARKALPNIMPTDGGTILGHLHVLDEALANIKGVDTVITGHGTSLMSWNDFEEFVRMNHEFVTKAQEGLKAGKKADEVAADITKALAEKFPAYTIALPKAKENVALVYDEIYRSGHYQP